MANEEKKTEKNKPKPCPKWLSAAAKKSGEGLRKSSRKKKKNLRTKTLKPWKLTVRTMQSGRSANRS